MSDESDFVPDATWDMIRRVDPTGATPPGDAYPDEYAARPVQQDNAGVSITRQPLEFWNASASGTAKVKIKNGNIGDTLADPTGMDGGADMVVTVHDGDHIWSQWVCARDVDSNAWTRTGAREILAGTLPDSTATLAVCDLGSVSVTSGNVTTVGSVRRGSLSWERCGVDDAFLDTFNRA